MKETQPGEWQKLEAQYTTAAEAEFFKQLEKALKTRGTLDVLRHGIKLIPGIRFSLCFFKPASGLNAALVGNYEANPPLGHPATALQPALGKRNRRRAVRQRPAAKWGKVKHGEAKRVTGSARGLGSAPDALPKNQGWQAISGN